MRALLALFPVFPIIALAPMTSWITGRAIDGGVLSLAAFLAGVACIALAMRSGRAQARQILAAILSCAIGGLLVGLAVALSSRALVVGGAAFLSAGALCLSDRRALVVIPGAALLALGAIHPADVDALLGWPLRALLAEGAASLLAPFGASVANVDGAAHAHAHAHAHAPIVAETVLLVEGRIADVESACAGTRSLTAFALCFVVVVAARELMRNARARGAELAVIVAFACGVVVLLAFSVVRVAAIAGLALLANQPALADIVHVPLGLFALLAGIAGAFIVLERWPSRSQHTTTAAFEQRTVLAVSLVAAALVVTAVAQVRGGRAPSTATATATVTSSAARFPSLSAGDLPLTDDEHALFTQLGAVASKRVWRNGSVLLVAGPRRAHHAPERCLAAMGLHVDAATTELVGDVPVRKLALSADGARYVGTSFFVSRDRVVASALERAMRDAVLGEGPWIFVSMLEPSDTDASMSSESVRAFVEEARVVLENARGRVQAPPLRELRERGRVQAPPLQFRAQSQPQLQRGTP